MTQIEYENLLFVCNTDRQREVLKVYFEKGSFAQTAKVVGRNESSVNRMIRTLKKRAASVGKHPHFISDPKIPEGYHVRSTSTLRRDDDGNLQWTKVDIDKEKQIDAYENIIASIAEGLPAVEPTKFVGTSDVQKLALYESNDIHFGALMSREYNHDRDWDLHIALSTLYGAIDYLIETTPPTEEAVIADLGDLMEMDDYSNMTSRSKNILDVDGRWDKALEVAILCMKYFVEKALTKHKTVYFYSIDGNHDDTSGVAVRYAIREAFRNEPRVIVNVDRRNIKYHIFGSVALALTHGHELRMGERAEACFISDLRAMKILDLINYIYGHFGHNHKDSVWDGANTKQESHRNLPPQNVWATNMGLRRQVGTMKAIIYDKEYGETGRNIFNVNMLEPKE